MTDYVPIDCSLHSEYELTILRQQNMNIAWQDPDGSTHLETITPLDLITAAGEEFLVGRTNTGQVLRIRLDHIVLKRNA